ncbi:hypothetical protein IAQ61_001758 [Plenodomus lingam]|uniref:uncharacterized protein n=1 Tax=Leptosphaeria maculans TaxID=5022 RepID=UPI003322D971|nr:hypothetical protein IAQ61_001758 [Plenodomus lingam]
MAPKIQPNAQKAATILAWFHRTAQAHSIKDLEKVLPQVSSISGMHVKDYLQALSDDSKIRVEKIGSGNWYWSFPSDEKKAKDTALAKVLEENNKASAVVAELRWKIEEAGAARTDNADMLMDPGEDRATLMAKHTDLQKDIEKLRHELNAYSEQDPVEMEKKVMETTQLREDVGKFSDQILTMEAWLNAQLGGGDREQVLNVLKMLYVDEYDEEDQSLREV